MSHEHSYSRGDPPPQCNPHRAMWLQAWRLRMGYTVPEAARALFMSEARLRDNLYQENRRASNRTVQMAVRLEESRHMPLVDFTKEGSPHA